VTRILPGRPLPLGAVWDGGGTNFSLFSQHAERVELCLLDDDGTEARLELTERTGFDWHGYVREVGPGQRYGYRVHGPHAPEHGHRFDPGRLLLDPYAEAIDGPVRPGGPPAACVVVDRSFDWEGDRRPERPWSETVIYETHVRGFTMRHPGVRADLRGTYAGLASDEAIEHLTSLGVTAVELLPVHQFADEEFLAQRGLTNYWGYATIGFFAPHAGYSATGTRGEQVRELKGAVKALHRAGLEVILDVVYNHTAEGGPLGPTLCFRGIDNRSYYRLLEDDPSGYDDTTGTGNTLEARHPAVIRLITDSLRHWALEYHVDGFRFDLAVALARERDGFDPGAGLLDAIHQDPVLSRLKLIAEPWDVGPDGYRVGAFPVGWSEWNGRYRDAVRDFWRGQGSLGELASRFTGSSDVYQPGGRGPSTSVNFVTCHDGFTLADLVSYEHKRNEANGEGNADGTDDNRSWNCGVEGPTDDAGVVALRARQQRNVLATLLLAQGVPMLSGGDEISRTQAGNNNAWCQDSALSWLDWELDEARGSLLAFTRRLVALRARHPVLRRSRFLTGSHRSGGGPPDVWWIRPDGLHMTRHDWEAGGAALGVFLNGHELWERTPDGRVVEDDSLLVLLNASPDTVRFRLPPRRLGSHWELELSTADPGARGERFVARGEVTVSDRSLLVLVRTPRR
jgi:glycogen operon protein